MPRPQYKDFKGISLLGRYLRKNQTPAEKILWKLLRKRQVSGFKFLRQHPVFYRVERDWAEFYIDFYCAELKLIVEVDGAIHESNRGYDSERDKKLLNKGIHVVRIKNEETFSKNRLLSKLNIIIKSILLQRADNKSHIAPPDDV
jgi:very-short-patch-repair endonuclease